MVGVSYPHLLVVISVRRTPTNVASDLSNILTDDSNASEDSTENVLPHESLDDGVNTTEIKAEPPDVVVSHADQDIADAVTNYRNQTSARRSIKPPVIFMDTAMIALNVRTGNEESSVPSSCKEGTEIHYKDEWLEPKESGLTSIEENGSWVLEPLPGDVKAIGNRWVYTKKD